MQTLIKKTILATFALSSLSNAQDPVAEEAIVEDAPITFDDWKANYSSALPSGDTGKVGNIAQIKVQKDQVYLNGANASQLMVDYGNLPSSYSGAIVALDESYVITFNFENSGYVKDDEKEDLDADELLEAFKESDGPSNEARREAGLDTLTTTGWAFKPKYNESTNNLEWAIIFKDSSGGETVNHEIKLLGRKGVMNATLLCDPSQLESLRPMLDETLAGFEYTDGNKYSQFEEGDKIADYGLMGLMLGGGFLAAKLGFFAKFWKFIVAGVVGFFVLIKKAFKKVTGKA